MAKLIDWMLATDPDERPNIIQVMAHHWVAPYVYKLPTSLGVIPCKLLQPSEKSIPNYPEPHEQEYSSAHSKFILTKSESAKCVVKKVSLLGVNNLLFPELEPNIKIRQLCGKNMALTDSGSVIKWREINEKNIENDHVDDTPKIVCLLYDNYFKNKGIKITYISSATHFDCFVTDRGILMTKGNGRYGCLGHGDRKSVITPKIVEYFLGDEIKMVSCSDNHVVALNSNDDVFCWGQNISNCLGLSKPDDKSAAKIFCLPIKVSIPVENNCGILKLYCGPVKTCLLMKDRRTLYYAGDVGFCKEKVTTNEFRLFLDGSGFRIRDISLTTITSILLYENGNFKVSTTTGSQQCNLDMKINFDNNTLLQNVDNTIIQERIETILSKEIESETHGNNKICFVISTNCNRIYMCKDFISFLMYIKEGNLLLQEDGTKGICMTDEKTNKFYCD